MTNSGSVYLHEAGFLVLNGLICMELSLWKSGQPDSRQQEATYWAHYLQTILQNCFNLHKSRNCPAQAVVNQVDWAPNDESSTSHATLEGHGALMMAYGHQALRQASLPRLHPPPLQAWTVQGWVNKCVSVYSRYEAGAMLFAIFFFLLSFPNCHLCAHKTYMLILSWVRGKEGMNLSWGTHHLWQGHTNIILNDSPVEQGH